MHFTVATGVKEWISFSLTTDGRLDKSRHLMGMFYIKTDHKGGNDV
jgi:hypothetical protein